MAERRVGYWTNNEDIKLMDIISKIDIPNYYDIAFQFKRDERNIKKRISINLFKMLNKDNSNLNDLCKLYKVDKTKIETLIKKKLSKQNTVKPESKLNKIYDMLIIINEKLGIKNEQTNTFNNK